MKPRSLAIATVVLATALAGALYWRYGSSPATVQMPAGESLEVAQLEELAPLPAFALERAGPPLTLADLRGNWSFVLFGYTNCPDACPATLGILGHVQEALRAQNLAPPRIVFVSLDPQRDTPEILRRYTAVFGPDTVGATGNDAALHSLIAFFGITFERRDSTGTANDATTYTIDHTTNFFLVTPDGRWLATFSPADDADAVLEDTRKLMRLRLP